MEFNTAKVVSYSKMGDLNLLEQVAYCARVSNPANQNNHLSSEKLCKYLLKNSHFSPFEMVHICMELETTRDISRQLIRHRSFSFQEFSQRYANVTDSFDFTTRECRTQHPSNRQMSLTTDNNELQEKFESMQKELIEMEKKYYVFCIENNIAKEQSRVILSEGLTKTRLYMNGTLRSWIHYLQIRTDKNTTQAEHCDLAIKILNEISTIFPLISEYVNMS